MNLYQYLNFSAFDALAHNPQAMGAVGVGANLLGRSVGGTIKGAIAGHFLGKAAAAKAAKEKGLEKGTKEYKKFVKEYAKDYRRNGAKAGLALGTLKGVAQAGRAYKAGVKAQQKTWGGKGLSSANKVSTEV